MHVKTVAERCLVHGARFHENVAERFLVPNSLHIIYVRNTNRSFSAIGLFLHLFVDKLIILFHKKDLGLFCMYLCIK